MYRAINAFITVIVIGSIIGMVAGVV